MKLAYSVVLFPLFAVSAFGAQTKSPGLDPISQAEDLRQVDSPALKAATTGSPLLRARAARAYGRIQQADGIAPLEALLKDPVPGVRVESAFALGQFGWKPSFAGGREGEILAALLPLRSDPDRRARLTAIEAIGKIGLLAAPDALAPKLSDADPAIRAETVLALFRYRFVIGLRDSTIAVPPFSDALLRQLLALSGDADSRVRRNVAYVFARLKDSRPAVEPALVKLAVDRELWVRYFAVLALQKSGSADGVTALLGALSDHHYEIRVAAVNALGALGALGKAQAAPITSDPEWAVRAAYAEAVGTSLPLVDLATLDPLRKDTSPSVRAAVLDAVVAREQAAALPDLQRALGDPNFLLRMTAATDAAGVPAGLGEALLLQAAKDPDVRVRSAAIVSLASATDAAAFAAIEQALASTEPAERGAAAQSLDGRTEADVPSAAWKAYLASPGPEWADLRTQLLAPLVALKGDSTTVWLKQALSDPSQEVVSTAYAELQARNVPNLGAMPVRALTMTPYRDLKFRRDPVVVLETGKGTIRIRCFAKSAPIHVANFVGRARDGLYDGKAWHRVVSDFVIQGASTDGTGWGSPGYELRAEINRARYWRGTVGMPRSDDFDSGSDEVFITHVPTPHLDGQYTVFGQVVRGIKVIDAIEVGDTITHAYVEE